MKLVNISENETGNEPVNWANKPEATETYPKYMYAIKQLNAASHQKTVFLDKLNLLRPHLVVGYREEELAVAKVTPNFRMKINGIWPSWWGVVPGTHNADKLWKTLEFCAKRVEKAQKLEAKYQRLVTKLKKVMSTESFNDLKYKVKPETVPSSEVPRRIYYTAKKYFENPYWTRENLISRYAGTVGHFEKFNTPERKKLSELNQALIRNGVPGMSKMYGGTVKVGGKWTMNRFVAFGANNHVIWKHIGGNTVYILGQKVSWGSITGTQPFAQAYQQKIFDMVKAQSKV